MELVTRTLVICLTFEKKSGFSSKTWDLYIHNNQPKPSISTLYSLFHIFALLTLVELALGVSAGVAGEHHPPQKRQGTGHLLLTHPVLN